VAIGRIVFGEGVCVGVDVVERESGLVQGLDDLEHTYSPAVGASRAWKSAGDEYEYGCGVDCEASAR